MNDTSQGAAGGLSQSTDKIVEDFRQVVADSEELMRSLAALGGEKTATLRAGAEANLRAAPARLGSLEAAAVERGRAAATATDEYVHANPWQSVGLAALVAGIAGFIIGIITARR